MTELITSVNLPPRLAEQVQKQIKEGWFTDMNSLIVEALRRYLETHQGTLSERFIREDIEWGLKGDE